MLDQLTTYRCKASTVLESVVAALILLISFSAGVTICSNVLLSGRSSAALRAKYVQKVIADSLSKERGFQAGDLHRDELIYRVSFERYPGFNGLQRLHITTVDRSGKQLAELQRIIPLSHE